jgi:hypothetical protein
VMLDPHQQLITYFSETMLIEVNKVLKQSACY